MFKYANIKKEQKTVKAAKIVKSVKKLYGNEMIGND